MKLKSWWFDGWEVNLKSRSSLGTPPTTLSQTSLQNSALDYCCPSRKCCQHRLWKQRPDSLEKLFGLKVTALWCKSSLARNPKSRSCADNDDGWSRLNSMVTAHKQALLSKLCIEDFLPIAGRCRVTLVKNTRNTNHSACRGVTGVIAILVSSRTTISCWNLEVQVMLLRFVNADKVPT